MSAAAPTAAAVQPTEAHWDERIKTLMAQVGLPESVSLYSAFKQFQNEMEQAAAQPNAQARAEQLEALLRQAREVHKVSLMVLCALNDSAMHPNMRKDVAFAAEGNRAAIAGIDAALTKESPNANAG